MDINSEVYELPDQVTLGPRLLDLDHHQFFSQPISSNLDLSLTLKGELLFENCAPTCAMTCRVHIGVLGYLAVII